MRREIRSWLSTNTPDLPSGNLPSRFLTSILPCESSDASIRTDEN